MIATLLLILTAIDSGALLTYLYDTDAPLGARLCAGACIGMALLGLVGFSWALLLGLTKTSVAMTGATVALPFALLVWPQFLASVKEKLITSVRMGATFILQPSTAGLVLILSYIFAAIVLGLFFAHAMFQRDGAIYTSSINNYGDLPFHVSVVSSFAFGENFPPEHPHLAGARLTYPFVADFIAAMFMRTGMSLTGAIFVENYVLGFALVGLLHRWAWKLTRNTLAAAASPLLILFSGGLGWWLLFDDLHRSPGSWGALTHLSHEYTTERFYGLRWGNILETILLPQRGFLLGLPIAIIIWTAWWQAIEARPPQNEARRQLFAAGVLAGLMPLIHTHSFVVIMIMAVLLALLVGPIRAWIIFFAIALLLAIPQFLWITHGSSVDAATFLKWQPGWDKGSDAVWWFWLKNTGLFIPLLLVALLWRGRDPVVSRRLLLFYAPFVLCFVVPNLINLAPFTWDNIKVMIYWYIASVPLVALLLARLWQWRTLWGRAASAALFVSMILAGALDVWRVIAKGSEWPVFDRDAVACADLVLKESPPHALILHAPTNNHPVFLTGRRSLIGLGAVVWSHGIERGSREQDIKRIYMGQAGAEALLRRYGVDYVLVGPAERIGMQVNERFFSRYPKVGMVNGCTLYRIAGK